MQVYIPKKGKKIDFSVQRNIDTRFCNSEGLNEINRPAIFFGNSSASCSTSVQFSATPANPLSSNLGVIRLHSKSISECCVRNSMVDNKFGTFQWEIINLPSSSASDFIRCLKEGLGSSMSWSINRGAFVSTGKRITYQYSEIESNTISNISIHNKQKTENDTYTNRQYSSPKIPSKNEEYKVFKIDSVKQRDLGISGSLLLQNTSQIIWMWKRTESHEIARIRANRCSGVFRQITQIRGTSTIDLFASQYLINYQPTWHGNWSHSVKIKMLSW